MAIDYSIAAIATIYNGRRYRSRLEAKWAAFFDGLKWTHEYEPYELGKWSPDFLVRPNGATRAFLVEVKPIDDYCAETMGRITNACESRDLWSGEDPKILGVLLTRVAPKISLETGRRMVDVGWMATRNPDGAEIDSASLAWVMDYEEPKMIADLVSICPGKGFFTLATGECGVWAENFPFRSCPEHTMGLWDTACNTVQWRGRGA